jgi:hypothetical protein
MTLRIIVLGLAGVVTITGVQQQPVFRADRSAVIVDVGVLKDGRPISGLAAKHFALTDSGVPQEVLDVARVDVPIDLSLLVDTSYSIDGAPTGYGDMSAGSRHLPAGEWMRLGMKAVASSLAATDRLQVLPFATHVREARTLQDAVRAGHGPVSGRTALFDAIVAAIMRPPVAGRRHVVVALTDGTDTASAVPEGVRNLVLDRSEAIVYLIACGTLDRRIYPKGSTVKIGWNLMFGGYDWILKDAAARTGGSFYNSSSAADFAQALNDALAEMRSRYLVYFQPRGVADTGWHPLQVTLPGHSGVEVRARKGYYAR